MLKTKQKKKKEKTGFTLPGLESAEDKKAQRTQRKDIV